MPDTRVLYTGNGVTRDFNIPFPFINREHVKVRLNLAPQVSGVHYDWTNNSTIRFLVAPPAGAAIEIHRETPIAERLVDFQNGAVLTQEELDLNTSQLLYAIQELKENYDELLRNELIRIGSNSGVIEAEVERLIAGIVQEILTDQLLADLQARINDIDLNAEAILQQADRLTSLQAVVDSLANIDGTGIATYVRNIEQQMIAGDEALAETLALIGAKSADSQSFILDLNKVRVTPTTTLASRLSGIDTRLDGADAAILAEQTARIDADGALANSIDQLTTRMGAAEANIIAEQTARINGDTVLAETLALLGAKNANGTAFVLNTATTLVDGTTSLASRLSGIEAKADRVRTFRQADAPDNPQVGDIWFDTDGTPANRAYRWDGSSWQSIDNADIAATKAALLEEQTVRASADSALASSITTLQTEVDGNTASIQTHATSIDGLRAQYTVKVDVNGRVAGFGLASTAANGPPTSSFIVVADRFAIVDPANTASDPKIPFAVSNGVVYMQNVVIRDALIADLNVGKLTAGTLTANVVQNADWNVGTGRIIWTNGAYMKVAGVGFGANHDLIEWFGPAMDISSCTRTNAIYYLATDGSAYFGGSLHAGVLANSGTSTNTQAGAEIVVGPFGSNGGIISVVYSYTAKTEVEIPYTNPFTPPQTNPTATIVLSRVIGTSAEVDVAWQNITGSYTYRAPVPASAENGFYSEQMSGSFTFTDNAQTTQNRTYRLRITSRNISAYNNWPNPDTQRLTIVATEE